VSPSRIHPRAALIKTGVPIVLLSLVSLIVGRGPDVTRVAMAEPGHVMAPNARPVAPEEQMSMVTLKAGKGPPAALGDTVTVNYTGTLEDGRKFDSSLDRNEPFSFTLGRGQVIRGWDVGTVGMQVGETRKLVIPPSLAYGPEGRPGIPPNSTLVFRIDLLAIGNKPPFK
jgi:hypothetical protein